MRLAPAYTSKLVVVLIFFAVIWNIFMIVNYQNAKQSLKTCPGDISEQDATLLKGERPHSYLKGLQMDIKETFRKFEGKNSTIGKAFRLAALHGKKGKERRNIEKTTTSLPDCQQTPFLLVLIHTAPANFMEREAIRVSWGRPQNSINEANAGKQLTSRLWKTVFLVGQTRNPILDELLRGEAINYKDIIFGDFIDSYRNLTRKMVFGIEWAAVHCKAHFVMKADDDSYVAILEIIQWLAEYQRTQGHTNHLYVGAAFINKRVYREKDSKFYVSKEEYPAEKFPPYAGGPGYVFSGSLLAKLSNAIKVVKLFPNEDACFGALMQYINVSLLNNDRFTPFSTGKVLYFQQEGYSLCKFNGPLVIHRISGKLQIQTHFNVLVLKHVPTICEHVKNGIGYPEYFMFDDEGVEEVFGHFIH